MDRKVVGGLVALAVGLVVFGWQGFEARAAQREAVEELRGEVLALAERPVAPESGLAGLELEELVEALGALEQRLERLEASGRRIAVADGGVGEGSETASASEDSALAEEASADRERGVDPLLRQEFEEVFARLARQGWNFSRAGEDYQRFLDLARETGVLDEIVGELEARVEADPGDVEGRIELADAYIARLMTVAGPEQGLWGARAEREWLAVTELDEGNWRSRSALGTNYSYYPEVMGKTADALRYLEEARSIQRDLEPAPEHVQVYLFLARMYERESQPGKAREALLEGLGSHPQNASLETALARLE